jgi:hypothetical protein
VTESPVLHALRCIGFAGTARVAGVTGLDESSVESDLIDLAAAGLVTHFPGEFGGWGVTEAGRQAHARRIADEIRETGSRTPIAQAYERFLVLNPEMLDLCAAWQLRSVDGVTTMNDHADSAYDRRILERLDDLHRRTEIVCADLSTVAPRFDRYRLRLAEALARSIAGELSYVTDDLASYHSIWCQLHEDLLATLGIPR